MPAISVKIENLAEIKRAFGKSPVKMALELNKAIYTSIFSIERDSKINTPVDTGRLRASHETRFTPLRGELEPTANYAIYVHEGTYKMKARPFLLKAVESNQTKVKEFFKKAVQNVLDDIGREV